MPSSNRDPSRPVEAPTGHDDASVTSSPRRDFLKTTTAALLGGAAAVATGSLSSCSAESSTGAANVQTQKNVRWRLASSFPSSLDTIYGAAEVLSKRVDELTGGRFKIRVNQAGTLVGALQVLNSVQQGSVEMGHSAGYYYTGNNDTLAFDTSVPFGLTARQHAAWLLQGGGMALMREVFGQFNIINLAGGNTGVQMGGWFRNPIRSLADMRGLNMRIPGLGGKVMKELGVNPQVIAGAEIYPSLERGVIDATEWVGPYDDLKLGFHEIVKNYHYPGWWEPGPALSFFINKDAWNNLPSNYQAALEVAAADASVNMMTRYDAKNPGALETLLSKNVNLVPFPNDVMTAAEDAMQQKHSELAAANADYRKVYEHWNKFKQSSSKWFATAEHAYANFVYRA